AVVADVMRVTGLDWLLALDVRAGVPAGAIDLGGHEQCCYQDKNRAIDRGPRQVVRAVTKNLWHRRATDMCPFRRRTCPPIVIQRAEQVPRLNGERCKARDMSRV